MSTDGSSGPKCAGLSALFQETKGVTGMNILRPRARIIRTIGDQLISGPEAALIELVKNSYDADSPRVRITIEPSVGDSPSRLLVKDNGHGMTLSDVTRKWFEPATDEKLKRTSSPNGRRLLGAKGIGRFAVARLGEVTKLVSVARTSEGKKERVTVEINWEDFASDVYLDEVKIDAKRVYLERGDRTKTGVELTVTRLREAWTRKKLEKLIKELRRVLSPLDDADLFEIHLDISRFTHENSGFDGESLMRELNSNVGEEIHSPDAATKIVPFAFQQFADYRVSGAFDELGAFVGSYVNLKGDGVVVPLNLPPSALLEDEEPCSKVQVQLNVYDGESESIAALFERMGLNFEKIGIRDARKALHDNAGVSIFRSGFRIRPYGDPDNDWLELERQRVQNPSRKIGASQISGRVIVQSAEESRLLERSSREGLEHNGAFSRLIRLMHILLAHVEDRRFAFRQNAGLSRKIAPDVSRARELAQLSNVRRALLKLAPEQRAKLDVAISQDQRALNDSLEELDAYHKLLQSRAALGMVIARVQHDGRRLLTPLAAAARMLKDQGPNLVKAGKQGDLSREQLPAQIRIISDSSVGLGRLFKQLDPISGRKRGAPSNFPVLKVVESCVELLAEPIARSGIAVTVNVPPDLRAYGYNADLQSALLNILDNAAYWLATVPGIERRIEVEAERRQDEVTIRISNNGPEIGDDYIPRLFEAGFTLKNDGMGIGLAIARETCRASKGELEFDAAAPQTTFVIHFPISK